MNPIMYRFATTLLSIALWLNFFTINALSASEKEYPITGKVEKQTPAGNFKPVEKARVQVWIYDKDKKDYKKAKRVKTDRNGSYNIGTEFNEQSSIFLIVDKPGLASGYKVVRPERDEHTVNFILEKPERNPMIRTKYRGYQFYELKDGFYYRFDGKVTNKPDFFFPKIKETNKSTENLLSAMGLSRKKVKSDEDILKRLEKVWNFLDQNAKNVIGNNDPQVKQAYEYLFKDCRKSPNSPVARWPSMKEYAATWEKFGFLPLANCTAWAQATATLMYHAGISPNKFAVTKIHYNMSWHVEHWIIGIQLNNRWYYLDPAMTKGPSFDNIKSFSSYPPTSFLGGASGYDCEKPFEIYILPGSGIRGVPFCGDPKDLEKLIK